MEFIEKVELFNEISGTKVEFNIVEFSKYSRLMLEEFRELLEAYNIKELHHLIKMVSMYEDAFKNGLFNDELKYVNRDKVLDSCADISVISVGLSRANGCDVNGAYNAVADNNLTKFEKISDGSYVVHRDAFGKVIKPSTFSPVVLAEFIK